MRPALLLAALLAAGCAAPRPKGPPRHRATFRMTCDVVRVLDGDTADIRCGEGGIVHRLRLTDVDAPERGERGFAAATERLRARLGARADFLLGGSPDRPRTDNYGRLLGRPVPGPEADAEAPAPVPAASVPLRRLRPAYATQNEGARRSRLTP